MQTPADLRYTKEHEWIKETDSAAVFRVGITDYAQDALGDIVYVVLPQLNSQVNAAAAVGELESTKSVSEVFAPLTGEITEVNSVLAQTPELINADPFGTGWLFEIKISDPSQLTELLSANDYQQLTGQN